jgi:diacylglycerol kinase family enzyme
MKTPGFTPRRYTQGVMGGIGVITNPLSRQNQRHPERLRQLSELLGESGVLAQPKGLVALDEVALRFRAQAIDVLCINGGDGTLHRVLTAMKHAYGDTPLPRIAVLPSGTMNIIANSIGIRGSASSILRQVMRAQHSREALQTTPRSLLKVAVEGHRDHYGFLFGNGIIAGFLEAYYEGGTPTPAKAAAVLGRGIFSVFVDGPYVQRLLKPFHGELTLDGNTWPAQPWTAVAVGTVEQIGLGFQPFRLVTSQPGHMHVVGIGGSVTDLARELPRIYRGRPLQRPHNRETACRELVIDGDQDQTYMIDGDFHRGNRRVTLTALDTIDFILTR